MQQRLDEIQWYHEFDFPNGLTARSTTHDNRSHRALWAFMTRQLDNIDFTGKSVLDIGCWDGYWSFYAERRGAGSVLATDDETQNWGKGTGLELAKELLRSSIETRTDVPVYDLKRVGGTFDIILFLGVYYHLVDPIYALTEIRHRCAENAILAVEGDFMPAGRLGDPMAAFFDIGHPMRCFVPTVPCLKQMLEAAYFEVVSIETYHGLPEQPVDRTFVVCRPVTGKNPLHPTFPPFGLHQYDPRYNDLRPSP